MTHLSDGTLRRMYDEPLAAAELARDHFNNCTRCQDRMSAVAGDARAAASVLAAPAVAVDTRAAYARLTAAAGKPRRSWLPSLGIGAGNPGHRAWRPVALVAVIGALIGTLAFTPVASRVVSIFEPQQSTTLVTVNTSSLSGFPDLSNWGEVKISAQPQLKQIDTAQAAAADTGLPIINPALPAGIPAPQFATVNQAAGTFTFSKAKSESAAARAGRKAPALPSNLDGARLNFVGGPAEVAVYGGIDVRSAQQGSLPPLAVAIARAPKVTSTGATVTDIENAVLAQPGIPDDLARQIRALGDPVTTLPIPVPVDKAVAHDVTLADGKTRASVISSPGIAVGVIFVRGGLVYAVAGSGNITEAQVLTVASSL